MKKEPVSLEQAKADLKAMGYRVRTKTYSEFKSVIVSKDGVEINTGNALTREHLEAHKEFYEYKNSHSVSDGMMKVVL